MWSYSLSDPSDPSGSNAARHDYMGTRSINLIGGTPSVNIADLDNEEYLDLTVADVSPNNLNGIARPFPGSLLSLGHYPKCRYYLLV